MPDERRASVEIQGASREPGITLDLDHVLNVRGRGGRSQNCALSKAARSSRVTNFLSQEVRYRVMRPSSHREELVEAIRF
jgi:hypothetical protein